MFDLRYHVASLAAVFLALVIGILVGVGISGRGFVDDAERDRLEGRIADLQGELDAAAEETDDLERRQQAAQEFVEGAYPVVVQNRLDGKKIAVLVVGSFDSARGGDGKSSRRAAASLHVSGRFGCRCRSRRSSDMQAQDDFGDYVGEEELGNLGRDLGRELVAGRGARRSGTHSHRNSSSSARTRARRRPTPSSSSVRSSRSSARRHGSSPACTRAWEPGKPAVGVEPSRVEQSAIPVFQRHSLSTVDGIDTPVGRLALVLLLAGATPGDYGVRDTAEDGILPPIEPLPEPASGG